MRLVCVGVFRKCDLHVAPLYQVLVKLLISCFVFISRDELCNLVAIAS